MRCITASASRSAGMARGEVNEVTSILAKPQALSRSIKATLSSVSMKRASFWKPSRVATSWMYRRGRVALIEGLLNACSDDAAFAQRGTFGIVQAEGGEHLIGMLAEFGRECADRARSGVQFRQNAGDLHRCAVH